MPVMPQHIVHSQQMARSKGELLAMPDCHTVVVAKRMNCSQVDTTAYSVGGGVELPFGSGTLSTQGRGKASWRSKNLVR